MLLLVFMKRRLKNVPGFYQLSKVLKVFTEHQTGWFCFGRAGACALKSADMMK